jgi:excisionase family DNA binding protein
MTKSEAEQLLTVAQAATQLNVSEKTIRRRISSGEIAVVRIGSAIRIHPKELQRYLTVNWDAGPSSPLRTH